MNRQSIEKFRKQVFRRIGYTVGLWDLLGFSRVCSLLEPRGSLGRRELVTSIGKLFRLKEKDARGKIDVAKALGLLYSVGDRYTLSALGRAFLGLVKIHGQHSTELKAFLLKRVIEQDADISLTLFVAVPRSKNNDLGERFISSLDDLLSLKRSAYTDAIKPFSLKRELPRLLAVKESQPKGPRFSRGRIISPQYRTKSDRFACIEIPDGSLQHYVRHAIAPRKGWLSDLDLLNRSGGEISLTTTGDNLLSFLKDSGVVLDTIAVIEPDQEVLLEITGRRNIITSCPVNEAFYGELISATYAGITPKTQQIGVAEFLELTENAYTHVKLAQFNQAEVQAVREVLTTPFLVKGIFVDFDLLLEEGVRRFPQKLYRLSSRRAAGAYISFKKN